MRDRHTKRWAEMIHTERWYCDLDHEMIEEFDRQEDLEAHLTAEHGKQLTTSQMRGRLRRNKRIAARDALVCPICDCTPDDILTAVNDDKGQLLWTHIGRHLKSLAFLSLPYDQFVTGESQVTSDSMSKSQDEVSGNSQPALEQRDADFAAIPETILVEGGDCKIDEPIHSACLSKDSSCCRLQPQDRVATFRAEADLSEDVHVDWLAACLDEKRAAILQPDYLELAKGLGISHGLPLQTPVFGKDGSSITPGLAYQSSLRDYWNTCDEEGPNARLIAETVEQLSRIFCSIDQPPRAYLDIKPENILRFVGSTDQSPGRETLGTLKLIDVNHSKTHLPVPAIRNQHATESDTTQRKIQSVTGEDFEEKYLVHLLWCLGCVTLEFIIWVLYGKHGLETFDAQLEGSKLYDGGNLPHIHHVVTTWTNHIRWSDPECWEPTATLDLLELVSRLIAPHGNELLPKRKRGTALARRPPDQPMAKKSKQEEEDWNPVSSDTSHQDQVMWDRGPGDDKGKAPLTGALEIPTPWRDMPLFDCQMEIMEIDAKIMSRPQSYCFTGKNRESVLLPATESILAAFPIMRNRTGDDARYLNSLKPTTTQRNAAKELVDQGRQHPRTGRGYKVAKPVAKPVPKPVPKLTQPPLATASRFVVGNVVTRTVLEHGRYISRRCTVVTGRYDTTRRCWEYQVQDNHSSQASSQWIRESELKQRR